MDNAGRILQGPTTISGRGGNQHYNPGDEVKAKVHENHRESEGHVGDEDPTEKTEYCAKQ